MRMLDLFAGRPGWANAFLARGWEVTAIDLVVPDMEIPVGCTFIQADILNLRYSREVWFYLIDGPVLGFFDAVCASSPCERFSVHGMKHFHPNPPYPELGVKLFNHTRALCEASGVPYVMENVRAAQSFVGASEGHAGSFYLWGSVPPCLPRCVKGMTRKAMGEKAYKGQPGWNENQRSGQKIKAARTATIPPELASCVADYAERLLEQQRSA